MKKHKIAFLINSLGSGGSERVVTTLANELCEEYEVYIITFINIKPFYQLGDNVHIISCVSEIKPSGNILEGLRNNFLLLKKINAAVKVNNIELLIGFMTTANILASIVGKLRHIPVIISERTNPSRQQITRFWNTMRRLTYPWASTLVVQTETIKQFFEHRIKGSRLKIIPNPIAADLTRDRAAMHLNHRDNIVLNVGRLIDLKAQNILIEAFAKTNHKAWKLILAGEGPERSNLEALIKKLQLTDKVHMPGRVRNVAQLYSSSKIFAFTSTYEGFPNALIEAMYFGMACVSTDCPTGPSELIEHGKNGYLVPVNDVDALANHLDTLMHNERKVIEFGKAGQQSVASYETLRIVENWNNLIVSFL